MTAHFHGLAQIKNKQTKQNKENNNKNTSYYITASKLVFRASPLSTQH
jgi:hypothetical protein